ncbi:hypothetical protein [uncultured Chryseobacterium sp.]|uniref:hypothetical protein n=1 Tax=uncultured Chryseobacterium sp. TaxID=259322 RepID=UPI0027DCCF1A|nr:hypothetical protein [uncultured Chryseobacterium sp.]
MKKAKNMDEENQFKPFSTEEMNERISRSEDDFNNKKFKTTSELLSKYGRGNIKSFGRNFQKSRLMIFLITMN